MGTGNGRPDADSSPPTGAAAMGAAAPLRAAGESNLMELVDEASAEMPAAPRPAAVDARTAANPFQQPVTAPAQRKADPLPLPAMGTKPAPPTAEEAQRAKEQIDALVKEARATTGPEA